MTDEEKTLPAPEEEPAASPEETAAAEEVPAVCEPDARTGGDGSQNEQDAWREEKALLESRLADMERENAEREAFARDFPTVNPYALPAEVEALRKEGNTLSGAYALYRAKAERLADAAREVREKNRSAAFPSGVSFGGDWFTEEEVRAMTREEVAKNYEKIRASQARWK